MTAEVPLQIDLFTSELKDTRTRKQKKAARQAEGYQQDELFPQRELAQFGVTAQPRMPAIARNGEPLGMALMIEDPRSEEEKELDRQREAEALTDPLPQLEPT